MVQESVLPCTTSVTSFPRRRESIGLCPPRVYHDTTRAKGNRTSNAGWLTNDGFSVIVTYGFQTDQWKRDDVRDFPYFVERTACQG